MSELTLADFQTSSVPGRKRGKDKRPRKKKGFLSNAAAVGGGALSTGISTGGTGALVGLITRPNAAVYQARLAGGAALLGAGYGGYQGYRKLKQQRRG